MARGRKKKNQPAPTAEKDRLDVPLEAIPSAQCHGKNQALSGMAVKRKAQEEKSTKTGSMRMNGGSTHQLDPRAAQDVKRNSTACGKKRKPKKKKKKQSDQRSKAQSKKESNAPDPSFPKDTLGAPRTHDGTEPASAELLTTKLNLKPGELNPLSIVIPYVNIALVYAPPPMICKMKTIAPCNSEPWAKETRPHASGYLARRLKKAGERKYARKELAITRASGHKYAMVVSDHAKERFHQRGRLTRPVYKQNYDNGTTVVVTYIPISRPNLPHFICKKRVEEACVAIRCQVDHMAKYERSSSRWQNPKLPWCDASIWKASKNLVHEADARRRNDAYKRVAQIDCNCSCVRAELRWSH